MKLIKALSLQLMELNQPVVTLYQLALITHQLYRAKSFRGESIQSITKDAADAQALSHALEILLDDGILDPYKGFPKHSVFGLLGRSNDAPAEVACAVDPFCYLSHLSAMEHHGLTNRMPSKLFLSSPGRDEWRGYATERMERDLKEGLESYREQGLPELRKTAMTRIGRTEVHRHNSIHLGAYKNTTGKVIRVSSVGRTFLDMLRKPDLCGGINHVIEVYEEHAESYLKLITDEIERHGRPIDKVRAGYILDEVIGLESDAIDQWLPLAQRGGSRRLDASEEYAEEFSEKWCLSINVYR